MRYSLIKDCVASDSISIYLMPVSPCMPPHSQNESLRKSLNDAQKELKDRDRHSAEATSSATDLAGKCRQAEQMSQRLRMELDWMRSSMQGKDKLVEDLRRTLLEDAARSTAAREVRHGVPSSSLMNAMLACSSAEPEDAACWHGKDILASVCLAIYISC